MTPEEKAMRAATPGRVLQVEFLDGFSLSQSQLAERTGIPRSTINEIVKGKRAITADTATAFGLFFGMSADFWLNLQSQYDLRIAEFDRLAAIRSRVRPLTGREKLAARKRAAST